MCRTIVITSGKGGVGKSSMNINLGYALANMNKKVCLIDADFGLKNLDVMLGLENRVIFDLKDVVGQIVFPLNTEETISCFSFLSLGFEK